MKKDFIMAIASIIILVTCNPSQNHNAKTNENVTTDSAELVENKLQINNLLDSFNLAAARADYDAYFNYYTDDAVFIGTDATENWDKKSFMIWAKPYFDKGKAWNFTSLERHVYFDRSGNLAWFDELLNTQMKICRGSGVVIKKGNDWKVQQYVLSMTVPNPLSDSVVSIKTAIEDSIIKRLKK
jgi:ketosteroid isomerase-like protein